MSLPQFQHTERILDTATKDHPGIRVEILRTQFLIFVSSIACRGLQRGGGGGGILAMSHPELTPALRRKKLSIFCDALIRVLCRQCHYYCSVSSRKAYLQPFAQNKHLETCFYSFHRFKLSIAKELRCLRDTQVVVLTSLKGSIGTRDTRAKAGIQILKRVDINLSN